MMIMQRLFFGALGVLLLHAQRYVVQSAEIELKQKFLDFEQQTCLSSCGIDFEEKNTTSDAIGVEEQQQVIRILSFYSGYDFMGRDSAAAVFFEKTGVKVEYDLIPDFIGLHDEIKSLAERKLPLYDGYICGSSSVGSAVQLGGWMDLTDVVRDRRELQWLDVLRGFRENIMVYDNRVRMLPLDGDAHFLYYRQDVFDAFELSVPRTWEEYWQVARAIHGKEFKNQTLVGSCIGRATIGVYWTNLILSSYTQTNGATEGFIFDSKDMTSLMGEAMADTLKMLELQAKYGHPEEFESPGGGTPDAIGIKGMISGECAMTYHWGDTFKASHTTDPQSHVKGLLKVAPTPGSTKVYNRQTKKLEPCNEESCGGPGGIYYDDIGWVNRVSYLAFGGWSAAVNDYITDEQKKLILDFFIFMSSPERSTLATILNASTPLSKATAVDPFRNSHMDVEKWVLKGWERSAAESYTDAIKNTLEHPNLASDLRFAGSDLVYAALEEETYRYLEKAILLNTLPDAEAERQKIRMEVANSLAKRLQNIVETENKKAETLVPLLEQYQRDLGIYKEPTDDDSSQTLALAIAIPAAALILVGAAFVIFFRKKDISDDSIWLVEKEELIFDDPQHVIGTGTFGVVLLAEYRGTKVAVKRVQPSATMKPKEGRSTNSCETDVECSDEGGKSAGTTSWATFSLSYFKIKSGKQSTYRSSNISKSKECITPASAVKANHKLLQQDFIREMRYVSKLRHPCITTVMGAVMSPNEDPMLVMEYMEHGSLKDILHNETMMLDAEILVPMLRDVTQGCRFLHAAVPQVIHGDLKAANILVDSKFRAKVADFGLSQKSQLGVSGTPFWMAPELLRQESTNTAASDVYSFGIILYETFSRRDPYEGEDLDEVLKLVADVNINKRPPVPKNCPPQFAALISDCLLANPDERPSFEELDKRVIRVDIENSENAASKKDRSTVSLFDIFPKHVAEALRDGKKVEAEHKDMVTIFFSDIVGFTALSSTMDPRKVANMLDRLYLKFDQLSQDMNVFKVETIGDAYMAVTNLVHDQSNDHAVRIADFAVEAVQAANETLIDTEDPGKGYVNIRVGFHSGSVVADVVGSRNPRYCLFGDTVNTASRMESTSETNRIHCSSTAAEMLRMQNCPYSIISRGLIEVKGKGKMPTFWIDYKKKPNGPSTVDAGQSFEAETSFSQQGTDSTATDVTDKNWRDHIEKKLNSFAVDQEP